MLKAHDVDRRDEIPEIQLRVPKGMIAGTVVASVVLVPSLA